jgi:hypothetical protein
MDISEASDAFIVRIGELCSWWTKRRQTYTPIYVFSTKKTNVFKCIYSRAPVYTDSVSADSVIHSLPRPEKRMEN